MMFDGWTDEAILTEVGSRLKRERLNRNLTRAEIAAKAGVSIKTIQNVENGKGSTVTSLVRLMRALGIAARFDSLVPEPGLSPIELLKLQGRERKRASGKRGPKAEN
jgi:putative transcriptional regulator